MEEESEPKKKKVREMPTCIKCGYSIWTLEKTSLGWAHKYKGTCDLFNKIKNSTVLSHKRADVLIHAHKSWKYIRPKCPGKSTGWRQRKTSRLPCIFCVTRSPGKQ